MEQMESIIEEIKKRPNVYARDVIIGIISSILVTSFAFWGLFGMDMVRKEDLKSFKADLTESFTEKMSTTSVRVTANELTIKEVSNSLSDLRLQAEKNMAQISGQLDVLIKRSLKP